MFRACTGISWESTTRMHAPERTDFVFIPILAFRHRPVQSHHETCRRLCHTLSTLAQ
ncbi:hypothetical protein K438DRAFT_1823745 [Mycena galopus ATCC 62051]|nr:hypothetical protein K438DRAFT_1823745 [Mycena galopus ATCC 62051]